MNIATRSTFLCVLYSPGTRTLLCFRVSVSNNVRTIRIWIGFLSLYSREHFGVGFIVITVIYSVSIRFASVTSVIRVPRTFKNKFIAACTYLTYSYFSPSASSAILDFFVVELDVFTINNCTAQRLKWLEEDLKNLS